MKRLILIAILGFSSSSFAWVEKSPTMKAYTYKYKMNNATLEIKREAASYEDGLRGAAKECFNHYKSQQKLTYDRGMDIIDICANPRS